MEIFDAAILGAVQGVTEFLPVSSSGHLVLGESLLGLPVEELLSFDVAVHAGTLTAILAYFWKDFLSVFRGGRGGRRLLLLLIAGTLPVVFIGFGLKDIFDGGVFRDPVTVGGFMIFAGVLFLLAEKVAGRKTAGEAKGGKQVDGLGLLNAFVIGLFQSIALIPGISRSGATISGGLFHGLRREEAAKFSFLLGGIAIAGAAALTVYDDLDAISVGGDTGVILTGLIVSAVVGYFSIYWLMKFLKKNSLRWFAVYLFLVGGASLVLS